MAAHQLFNSIINHSVRIRTLFTFISLFVADYFIQWTLSLLSIFTSIINKFSPIFRLSLWHFVFGFCTAWKAMFWISFLHRLVLHKISISNQHPHYGVSFLVLLPFTSEILFQRENFLCSPTICSSRICEIVFIKLRPIIPRIFPHNMIRILWRPFVTKIIKQKIYTVCYLNVIFTSLLSAQEFLNCTLITS